LHIKKVIFDDHEFRTLQNLLCDYKRMISNYGHNAIVRSSYVKELLIREFGDDIGFYEKKQRNASELVYDKKAAGTYVEAALLSLGISDEQLLRNVASRIRDDTLKSDKINWPPSVVELEKDEASDGLLFRLLSLLRAPNKKVHDDDPKTHAIASILKS